MAPNGLETRSFDYRPQFVMVDNTEEMEKLRSEIARLKKENTELKLRNWRNKR